MMRTTHRRRGAPGVGGAYPSWLLRVLKRTQAHEFEATPAIKQDYFKTNKLKKTNCLGTEDIV